MKKWMICALAGAMAFSFTACGSSGSEKAEEETAGEQETERTEAEETNDTTDVQEAEAAGAQGTEEAGAQGSEAAGAQETEETAQQQAAGDADADVAEAADGETSGQNAAAAEDAPDVSAAVTGEETSETAAVPLGSWVKTSMYATQDSCFHTVYVRVTKVTTQSADAAYVESAIETSDAYADEEDVFHADALEVPEDGELVVLDYEVYVPEDFPAAGYGIPEPRLYFSVRNIGGGGVPSTDGAESYVGLGTTVDLNVRDAGEVYQPGHVYSERCIFAMVKGYTNYVTVYSSYPDGTSGQEADIDDLYTVYHAAR